MRNKQLPIHVEIARIYIKRQVKFVTIDYIHNQNEKVFSADF